MHTTTSTAARDTRATLRISRLTASRAVTKRMMPRTLPLYTRGADTAITCWPVLGSLPDQVRMVWVCTASEISGVFGLYPEKARED